MFITCGICLDLIHTFDNVVATPCGHVFHDGCLQQWLPRNSSCPQCRFSIKDKSQMIKLFLTPNPSVISGSHNSEEIIRKTSKRISECMERKCKRLAKCMNGDCKKKANRLKEGREDKKLVVQVGERNEFKVQMEANKENKKINQMKSKLRFMSEKLIKEKTKRLNIKKRYHEFCNDLLVKVEQIKDQTKTILKNSCNKDDLLVDRTHRFFRHCLDDRDIGIREMRKKGEAMTFFINEQKLDLEMEHMEMFIILSKLKVLSVCVEDFRNGWARF